MLAQAKHPAHEFVCVGVRRAEEHAAVGQRGQRPAATVVRFDPPGHVAGDADPGLAAGLSEAPRGAVAVGGEVEVGRAYEVVGGACRVRDARADAREAEGTHRAAQVAVADEVPLVADDLQAVRVHRALTLFVAADRVVTEDHALALGDGRLELGQHGGAGACPGVDGEPRRRRLLKELRAALHEAHQGEAQGLRVGEAALEHGEARGEGGELVARELDGWKVVGAGRQTVGLSALRVRAADDLDAEAGELGAVLVEAPLERLVGHRRVALDARADLADRDRVAAAREQQGDQRQAPDELVGVSREALFPGRALVAHVCASSWRGDDGIWIQWPSPGSGGLQAGLYARAPRSCPPPGVALPGGC